MKIQLMLSISPVRHLEACEDYAIHAFESFEGICLSEHEDLSYISQLAQALQTQGKPFALYINYSGEKNIESALIDFENDYCGCFESPEDYAQDYYEQTGQSPQLPKRLKQLTRLHQLL